MIVTLFFGLFSGTSLKVHAANVRVTGEKAIAIPVSFNGDSKDYNCGNVSATKLDLSFQVTPYDGIDLSKEITETYQIVFEKDKLDEAFDKFVTPYWNLWDTELFINSFAYLDGCKDKEENNQIVDLFQNNSFKLSKKEGTYYLNDSEILSNYIDDDTVTCVFDLSLENNKGYDKYIPQKVGLIFDLHSNNFIYDGSVTIENLSMKATNAENTGDISWNFIPGDSTVSYKYQGNFFCSGFRLKKGQECFAEYFSNQYLPITPIKNICSLGTKHNFGNAKTNPGCIFDIYDNGSLENIADGTIILKGMPVIFGEDNLLVENINGCTTQFQLNNKDNLIISSNSLASLNVRIPKELMDLYVKNGIRIQPYVNYKENIQDENGVDPSCDNITVLTMQNGEIVAQVYKDCNFEDNEKYKKSNLIATNLVSYNEADSYYDVSVSTNVICDPTSSMENKQIIVFDCNVVPVFTNNSIQSMVYVSEYSLKDSSNHEYLTPTLEKNYSSRYNWIQNVNTFFTNYAFGKSHYQNIYTINYVLNDAADSKASNPSENITKYNENVAFELNEPSRTGYTFEGWYSDAELLTPVSILKNQDATVYASWKKINSNLQVSFVNSTQSPVYTGSFIRPAVIVTITVNTKKVTLKQNSDYTVSYKNNREVGTAQAIITGINGYEGSVIKSFPLALHQ